MVRLSWCWLMVEAIVIPHGFLKWFYLSFYIHPSFLVLLQIFLWITKLYNSLLSLLLFLLKISTFLITTTLTLFSNKKQTTIIIIPNHPLQNMPLITTTTRAFKTRSSSIINISTTTKIYQEREKEEEEVVYYGVLSSCSSNSHDDMGYASSPCSEEEEYDVVVSSRSSNSPDMGYGDGMHDQFIEVMPSPEDGPAGRPPRAQAWKSNLPPVMAHGETNIDHNNLGQHDNEEEEEIGPFYKAYLQKMKWFDVLNHDRFFATKAMMNQKHLSENIGARRVAKSLEKDFELVYVAQSCLSWEALHHHFTKVKAEVAAVFSNPQSPRMLFHNSVPGRFQKFQILLERFLEEERCGGTRHSNYVHRKYSLQTLLLVPHLSGYPMEDGKMLNEEGMKAIEVLKAIEKCITTFWLYVKVDNTKRLGWSRPAIEDPRDLNLLLGLTKSLRKKEVALKKVEGKKRCWLRRRAVLHNEEEPSLENTELVCTRIDMKLVGRVLKLPIISTSHLQWCQHKLDNINFNRDGKIIRAQCTSSLFPS